MKKLFVILLSVMLMCSCTLLSKKHQIIISPEQVSNAIITDDNYLLNKYLSDGFPIDYDSDGETLLRLVLENNSLKCLTTLLDRDVDIETRDSYGRTPIFYVRSIDALKLLINDGANIDSYDKGGENLLTYFIKNKPVSYSQLLIDNKVALNDWNTLFWAVISGNSELIRSMAKAGADFSLKDKEGNYPVYYAYNKNNIMTLLDVAKYNIDARNIKNENVLGEVYLRAVADGYKDVVEKIISLGINPEYMSYGDNAISIAEINNDMSMLEYLKNKGIK
ncbi:ankyrin repeat domain-containing protein [Fusobacterium sp.]|uniref:ankyrin repeat domain-containing protein n=1 Tax=Fusobacterium sp. TaxID=68766 RepID=UPI00396CDF5C